MIAPKHFDHMCGGGLSFVMPNFLRVALFTPKYTDLMSPGCPGSGVIVNFLRHPFTLVHFTHKYKESIGSGFCCHRAWHAKERVSTVPNPIHLHALIACAGEDGHPSWIVSSWQSVCFTCSVADSAPNTHWRMFGMSTCRTTPPKSDNDLKDVS